MSLSALFKKNRPGSIAVLIALFLFASLVFFPQSKAAASQDVTKLVRFNTGCDGVAVNSSTGLVYVTNNNDNTVTVMYGPSDTIVKKIPVGKGPGGVAVNPSTNRIYVANNPTSTGSISVIDGVSSSVIKTIPVGLYPGDVTVNSVTNKVYVPNFGSNSVSVIDGASDTVVRTIPVQREPEGISANISSGKVYVACAASPATVDVIDGSTDTVTKSVPIASVFDLAANPATNKVYAVNGASNRVSVIDGSTDTVLHTVAVASPQAGVGVDAMTNRIYVTNTMGGVQDAGSISVINGQSDTVTDTVTPGVSPGRVCVNAISGKVYMTADVDVLVLFEKAPTGPAFYFAEGTCRPGFDPYFCIQNPGGTPANVTLTYMKGDGTTAADEVTVAPQSRATVNPRNKLGTGDDPAHDFSTVVDCANQQIIVERPMYFNYKGSWTGGHDIVGAVAPSTTFYFAEGTCRPGFDPYFCIQNPGGTAANVTLTYMKGDGSSATGQVTVAPHSRSTLDPRLKLGTGDDAAHDFSTKLECTNYQQIIYERPMYFNYHGWTGGSDVAGVPLPTKSFSFAEGTCRPGFDPYFCIQNPGTAPTHVGLLYMRGDGTYAAENVTVAPNTRVTVNPRAKLGTGDDAAHDFATTVSCQDSGGQLIVERPMYFNYHGWDGGDDVVGAQAPSSEFDFAEGTCRPGFDPYFCIQNVGSSGSHAPGPVNVTITYMKGDGTTATDQVTVPLNSRVTVNPKSKLGTGDDTAHDFSTKVVCTNGQLIVVERPMYFNYKGVWTGGSDVVGFMP